ncbi:MAG: hypothetical protein IKT42_06945 [Clostridia bacterium]|nr:hypothetical protein [Clostridia bacterium]
MIVGYDYEVFKYNWLVVFVNPFTQEVTKIWDDPDALKEFYDKYNDFIYVGYNSRFYDQWVFKSLLCGFNAWQINDWIIHKQLPGWQFSKLLNKIRLYNYDVQPDPNKSLKELEAYQGHNIHETGVDFNIDRPLTDEEKRETEKYCLNDVMETLNVFAEKKADFEALLGLIKMFKLPFSAISKTKAQVSAQILECEFVERKDDWELYTLPCLQLNNPKYRNCINWFFDKKNQWYKKVVKGKNGKTVVKKNPGFTVNIAGVEHSLGLGGIHGALEKYVYKCSNGYLLIHVDVESYYPSLMIYWELLTRNARKPERFKEIYERRLQLKHEGKKKEQAPLKIVINGTFGISKDPNNKAYDPRNANMICINGQLLLIDLIEKLEAVQSFELVQSNTDGLIIKIHKRDFAAVDDICYEWETRTKMRLEFEYIDCIYQGDVNNYIFRYADVETNGKKAGKWERKGGYVKELSPLDNDLPIINKALNEYLMHGITPAETIRNCDDYMMFQKVVKLSSKYEYVEHNGRGYTNKCYRVFASKNPRDGSIYAVKADGAKGKYANTPESCYIENGSVKGAPIPEKLNIDWYISLANDRLLNKFGVEV